MYLSPVISYYGIIKISFIKRKGVAMPIYEFRCLECSTVFELLELTKKKDKKGMKCPNCNSKEIERLLSRVSVVRSSDGKATKTAKDCGGSTCTTIEVPGRK
jgi:putative FmdB family regulatory protein